ncbi:superoxide dismutase family protein [Leptolyngbya sp. FACHB-671]|uniref:superoxide dismutase family protein n=1 Tax=Leptolyngbya sp. FACHB-671 TaxID=2692812 RepID=UPI0016881881|nr:superoxide dismutase family protein [Leptolyngbya sp. FACHB-671]MBD1867738.1 superoxide dismutase family protein [Cyanobacteria bacterium FACHB-471]MBD2068381.1 superoxide dismutase family protein [Leptolyngbya sp. FACHB-671]
MTSIGKIIKTLGLALCLSLLAVIYSVPAATAAEIGKAIIEGTSESASVTGEARFIETDAGLQINATLDTAPSGNHGFHIHEFGSCAEGGNAAGGHFNPDGVKHGKLATDGFANAHAGDLGNISVAGGEVTAFSETLPGLTLNDGKYAIAGRAIIVHENEDDFGQPTGNAGGRIGCGTIFLSSDTSS